MSWEHSRNALFMGIGLVLAACSTNTADDASGQIRAPSALTLPGDRFYPESLHSAADGTISWGVSAREPSSNS